MNRPLRLLSILVAVLLCSAARMPAPISVPDEAPAPKPVKKRKVVHKEPIRRAKPAPSPADASPSPSPSPADGDEDDEDKPATPAPQPAGESVRRSVVKAEDGTETVYVLSATQPFNSSATGQKITITINEAGVRRLTGADKKSVDQPYTKTQVTSINTGRTKSVSQLRDLMRSAFGRFAGGTCTPGQELGKIGDARYGGELHIVAETAEILRFDYVPATANTMRYRRADIQRFAELLAQ